MAVAVAAAGWEEEWEEGGRPEAAACEGGVGFGADEDGGESAAEARWETPLMCTVSATGAPFAGAATEAPLAGMPLEGFALGGGLKRDGVSRAAGAAAGLEWWLLWSSCGRRWARATRREEVPFGANSEVAPSARRDSRLDAWRRRAGAQLPEALHAEGCARCGA